MLDIEDLGEAIPAIGRYARLPAEGFAAERDLADPTGVRRAWP